MGKRDTNTVDANLPPAPSVANFCDALAQWLHRETLKGEAPQEDPIHGRTFQTNAPQKKRGTHYTDIAGVQCAENFRRLCSEKGAQYRTLDDWMVSWAQWTIAPVHLGDTQEEVDTVRAQRSALCGNGAHKEYCRPVDSFRT